jgi:hypothetical protein
MNLTFYFPSTVSKFLSLDVAKNTPMRTIIHPTIIKNDTSSSRKILPQIIPNTGRKYATVDVFTAPTFSMRRTYPINDKPVETTPSQRTDKIALFDGKDVGRLNKEIGKSKIVPNINDQPISTILLIFIQYFCMNTPENA